MLAILCVGVFMLLLDGTIVNIAIPSILTAFSASYSEVEWVMNAYLLVFAVSLITTGRLGDLYGRKRIFAMGLVLFTLASLACGFAPGRRVAHRFPGHPGARRRDDDAQHPVDHLQRLPRARSAARPWASGEA